MVTEEHMKELISKAYANIIAANAGISYSKPEVDYGIDGTFRMVKSRGNRLVEAGVCIDFQLKATINAIEEENCIKYNLEAKNYNDLVDTEVCIPRILILYSLPREREKWVQIANKETILQHCAWWCSLKGEKLTDNDRTVTIRIPKVQRLTSEVLTELIEKVKRGEEL